MWTFQDVKWQFSFSRLPIPGKGFSRATQINALPPTLDQFNREQFAFQTMQRNLGNWIKLVLMSKPAQQWKNYANLKQNYTLEQFYCFLNGLPILVVSVMGEILNVYISSKKSFITSTTGEVFFVIFGRKSQQSTLISFSSQNRERFIWYFFVPEPETASAYSQRSLI